MATRAHWHMRPLVGSTLKKSERISPGKKGTTPLFRCWWQFRLIESTGTSHNRFKKLRAAPNERNDVNGDRPVLTSEPDHLRLARMFADHHVIVWRSLRRRGLAPDKAADATQETFLIALGRLADIPQESERAFLLGTARRVAHTLGRNTVCWQLDDDMDQLCFGRARSGRDEHADLQLCDIALSKLNPELAEAFVLYEIEGLSCPEDRHAARGSFGQRGLTLAPRARAIS